MAFCNCVAMYLEIVLHLSSLAVSTKHRLRSKTVSPILLRLRRILLSSISDHQEGYGLVLAFISRTGRCLGVPNTCIPFKEDLAVEVLRTGSGSTCTISSQLCTIDFTREVLPTPITVSDFRTMLQELVTDLCLPLLRF